MSNEDSYYGWFVIDHDNGGSPDPLYEASLNANLQQERQLGKLYGDPGSGLDYSAFGTRPYRPASRANPHWPESSPTCGSTSSPSGPCTGSTRTASPSTRTSTACWSHRPATAGACLVRGREELQGRQRHQIREPGSTKPGAHEHQRRALIKGSDGTPVVKMSENMATQRDNWASTLETYHVAAQWMVCMVPGGHNGNPDVSEAVWPGNVRVVTPGQLVAEIQSLSLLPVDNIPPRVVRLFTSAVKQQLLRQQRR